MSGIQKLSTEQKLAKLTERFVELFTIQTDPALSLTEAFNALVPDRFHGGLHKLVKAVAKDFGVPSGEPLRRVDAIVADICEAAEKKNMDTALLRAYLPNWTKANDVMAHQLASGKTTVEKLFYAPGSIEVYRKYMGLKNPAR